MEDKEFNLEIINDVPYRKMTKTIKNAKGRVFDFEAVFKHMDWDIKDEMLNDKTKRTNQVFFNVYCKRHTDKYNEVFEFNKYRPKIKL
jgi:hypothetical protein